MSTSNGLNINKKLGNILKYIVLMFAFVISGFFLQNYISLACNSEAEACSAKEINSEHIYFNFGTVGGGSTNTAYFKFCSGHDGCTEYTLFNDVSGSTNATLKLYIDRATGNMKKSMQSYGSDTVSYSDLKMNAKDIMSANGLSYNKNGFSVFAYTYFGNSRGSDYDYYVANVGAYYFFRSRIDDCST